MDSHAIQTLIVTFGAALTVCFCFWVAVSAIKDKGGGELAGRYKQYGFVFRLNQAAEKVEMATGKNPTEQAEDIPPGADDLAGSSARIKNAWAELVKS
jgi:hypothetical protein